MKILILFLCAVLCGTAFAANIVDVQVRTTDGKNLNFERNLESSGDVGTLNLSAKWLQSINAETVEVLPKFAKAKVGDDGYYVMPNGMRGKFSKRKEDRYDVSRLVLALSGMKIGDGAFAAIIKSGRFECTVRVSLRKDVYQMSHFFNYKEVKPYEDIVLAYEFLRGDDANYSGIGRAYRKWQLDRGEVKTLRERVKTSPELAYAAASPEVRVRQGWKPVPTPVDEQTLETEPPMKAMVSFERVGDIIDEMKKQGVNAAELCLVGWNIRGHDGRWPTPFPVEQSLGGEIKLRGLISKAQAEGYQIVCHTNSSDAYRISPDWSEDCVAKRFDGSLFSNAKWSGGKMYHLCFEKSYYNFASRDLPKIADLGFRGLHYIDVISTISPVVCHDKNHPINGHQSADYSTLMLDCAARNFGGAASEGGYDHVASKLDYALYITFELTSRRHQMIDDYIPIWHIVYNGIILSNAASATINYSIKEPQVAMKMVEYACRPSFYIYSSFRDDSKNWMGTVDLKCGNQKELSDAVAAIKKGTQLLDEIGYLQFEFLDRHDEIASNVFKSEFSDGSVIVCNYGDTVFKYKQAEIEPMSYKLFKPSAFRTVRNLF